jgi:hypothetical protein
MAEATAVTVTTWDIDPEIEQLLLAELASDATLVVLPRELDGADGIYDEDTLMAPKELRADGASARFLHADPDHRRFLGEYSADLVLALVVGIGANVTTDTAEAVYRYVRAAVQRRRGADPNLRVAVKIARLETRDGTRVKGLEITGPTEEAAAKVLSVLTGADDE